MVVVALTVAPTAPLGIFSQEMGNLRAQQASSDRHLEQ